MKKTETINLGGVIFHIDDDAFRQLQNYIASIKQHFADTEAADEIAADIESRIAELLQEKHVSIVTLQQLDEITAIMGQPEDYVDEEADPAPNSTGIPSEKRLKKRLYRYQEDKIIAGVASGLGIYFDVDPLLFRIIFFLTLFVGGFGLWSYLILWLLVPKADSASDYLKMKGEPITAETIGKAFTDKVESSASEPNGNFLKSLILGIGNVIRLIFEWTFKLLAKLIYLIKPLLGFLLLVIGLAITIGTTVLVLAFCGKLGIHHDMMVEINTLSSVIVNSLLPEILVYTSFILLIGIPVYQLIYLGLRLIFGLAKQPGIIVGLLTSCWILAVISSIVFTISGATQFSDRGQHVETIALEAVHSDTLRVTLNEHPDFYWDEGRVRFRKADDRMHTMLSAVELDIRQSPDSDYHLQVVKEARANDYVDAKQFARHIDYQFDITGNSLLFDQYLSFTDEESYHFQEVRLVLQIPVGKTVFLDESLYYFIDDMNVDGIRMSPSRLSRSHQLVGRSWLMAKDGLSYE